MHQRRMHFLVFSHLTIVHSLLGLLSSLSRTQVATVRNTRSLFQSRRRFRDVRSTLRRGRRQGRHLPRAGAAPALHQGDARGTLWRRLGRRHGRRCRRRAGGPLRVSLWRVACRRRCRARRADAAAAVLAVGHGPQRVVSPVAQRTGRLGRAGRCNAARRDETRAVPLAAARGLHAW